MPAVFSPGEPETRPLDPTAVVYCTAQQVADLLDIGPQDPILMSADADTDAVYITGNEFRQVGFSVGDKIRVYSDADPFGEDDLEITAIERGSGDKSAHVKITFSGATLTATDYEVADNGYVQNKASFTNGRTRGVTKAKVEHVILKMQDRIDNMTRNAWRPYLVAAEYINFDTYKPYRRRYYTDYVGTSPLLFRNIQQMLRIELWQGDDYREIGAAEARIKLDDISNLSGKTIAIGVGNGSVAFLDVGSASTNWRGEFDATTAAQNLADLINKEDRVSKTAVEFIPSFKLEGSSSNIAVHNEFLASANSDYGTGVVKVTSMRPVKAGEQCSIVTDTSDIEIDQTEKTEKAITGKVVDSGLYGITFESTEGFLKSGVLVDEDNEIYRYTKKTSTALLGIERWSGTAWQTATEGGWYTPLTTEKFTQHKFVVDLQGSKGNTVVDAELGETTEKINNFGDNARLRDWWIDHEMGIIYFNNSYPFFEWNAVKVSYIYGERYVEKAIEDICAKMVAIELLMADDRSVLIPEGTQNIDLASKVQLYQAEIERTLPKYVELVVFE